MNLVHNETIYEALEAVKNEVEEIEQKLDLAIDELIYADTTGNDFDRYNYIKNAKKFIEEAKGRLHKK